MAYLPVSFFMESNTSEARETAQKKLKHMVELSEFTPGASCGMQGIAFLFISTVNVVSLFSETHWSCNKLQ